MEKQSTIIDDYNKNTEDSKPNPRRQLMIILKKSKYQLLFLFLLLSILAATLTYFYFNSDEETKQVDERTCLVREDYQIPCGVVDISSTDCIKIDCCYNKKTCYHPLPSVYGYEKSDDYYKPIKKNNPFNVKMLPIELIISSDNDEKLDINLKLREAKKVVKNVRDNSIFKAVVDDELLSLKIFRKDSNDTLLSTKMGPLIASDGYWEWTLELSKSHLYGVDDFYLKNETMETVIYKNSMEHHATPAFIAYNNNRFHGVLIEHEGPLEVKVLPSKLIDIRGLGKEFKISLLQGPTPTDIYKQFRSSKSFDLKTWMLKPHICRDGVDKIENILKEVEQFQKNNQIDYGSDCFHENLYVMLDDIHEDLKGVIGEIQEKREFVLSLPPHVVVNDVKNSIYNEAVNLKLFYKYNDEINLGNYTDHTVAYIDYTNPNIVKWIGTLKKYLEEKLPLPTAIILRDNWLQDDSFEMDTLQYFPYWTSELEKSMSFSLQWNATASGDIPHYYLHNKYALDQVEAFDKSNNLQLFATSSYTQGINYVANIQNIEATWTSFEKTIKIALLHGLFGNPYITIPVCGSIGDYDESLCIRWYYFAATMPIFRISSEKPRRDPLSLPTKYAQNAAIEAITKRKQLLPHFYTILKRDEPLIRPMFYEFHEDKTTLDLYKQYLIGESLIVVQNVLPLVTSLDVYLPKTEDNWYEFWGGIDYGNGWINFDVLETDWNMFIANGYIVPLLLEDDQQLIWKLVVALYCDNKECGSNGEVNYGGFHLRFSSNDKSLTITKMSDGKLCVKDNNINIISYVYLYTSKEDPVVYDTNIDLCTLNDQNTISVSF